VAVAALPELVDLFYRVTSAMVVLAQSAVFSVREKTTLRAAFGIGAKGWLVAVVVIEPAMPS
jgi:hypothetical protein